VIHVLLSQPVDRCGLCQGDMYVAKPHSACRPVQPPCPMYMPCFLLIADDRNCSYDNKVSSHFMVYLSCR